MLLQLLIRFSINYKTFPRQLILSSKRQLGTIGLVLTNGTIGEKREEKSYEIRNNDVSSVDCEKLSRISSDYDAVELRQILDSSSVSATRQIKSNHNKKGLLGTEYEKTKETVNIGKNFHKSDGSISLRNPQENGIAEKMTTYKFARDSLYVDSHLSSNETTSSPSSTYISALNVSLKKANTPHLDGILNLVRQTLYEQQSHIISWATAKRNRKKYLFRNAGKFLHEVTGYSEIEKYKILVEQLESEIEQAREAVKICKLEYERAIQNRCDSQKEINELLTRKHTWTPQDVERFTELYKNDHKNMCDEVTCKKRLDEAEQNGEAVQIKLTASILTRYHEEQMWSDKIRQVSTWGTWMLMGVNIMIFATATFFVEPWKRRKLVYAIQTELQENLDEYSTQLKTFSERLSSGKDSLLPLNEYLGGPEIDHRICFSGINSWNTFKKWALAFVTAMQMPGDATFTLKKPDFAVFSGILVAFGWLFGSLINSVVF